MSVLQVSLFGRFEARKGDAVLSGLETHKVQELFSYLLIFRDSPHSRDSLAALLWSDCAASRPRKYLRQALWHLQTAIGPDYLLIDAEWVQVNPESEIGVDTTQFERAFASVRGVPGKNLTVEQARSLTEVVPLYRGDLLCGWHQDWCLFERERMQTMYLAMLDKLLGYYESRGEYEVGLYYGTIILRYDRARERTRRRLMRLHYLSGNRIAALREYEACVIALDEELGVKPAKSTRALYEQIRDDKLDGSNPHPAGNSSDALNSVLYHLRRLQSNLAGMQAQVQQDIKAVEREREGQEPPDLYSGPTQMAP